MARGKMAAWILAVSVAAAAAICVWPVDEGLQVKTAIVSGGQLV